MMDILRRYWVRCGYHDSEDKGAGAENKQTDTESKAAEEERGFELRLGKDRGACFHVDYQKLGGEIRIILP